MALEQSRSLLWLPVTPSLFQMRKRWGFCFSPQTAAYSGVWKRYCLDSTLSGSSGPAPALTHGAHQASPAQPGLSHPQGRPIISSRIIRLSQPGLSHPQGRPDKITTSIPILVWTGWQWASAEAEWQLQRLHNWGHEVPPSQGFQSWQFHHPRFTYSTMCFWIQGDMKLAMTLTSPRTKPRQPVGLPKVKK